MNCHVAVLFVAMNLAAQDPQRDARWLAETLADARAPAVAWAAHHARELADKTLIAPLQRALAAWRADESVEGRTVVRHVLDALIEQQAKVPPAELLPLIDDPLCGTAAFVLLAQHPRQNEAELLELFRNPPPATGWVAEQASLRTSAIGNLLCAQRAPGFARVLWQQLDLDLHVEVVLTTTAFGMSFKQSRNSAPGQLDGFPPARICQLADSTTPGAGFVPTEAQAHGATLLADGSTPIYFGRMPAAAANRDVIFATQRPDGLAWLQQLAGTKTMAPPRILQLAFVPPTCVGAVDEARTRLRTFKETLRRELVASKALTEADAAELSTAVAVIAVDKRSGKPQPLPEIPER